MGLVAPIRRRHAAATPCRREVRHSGDAATQQGLQHRRLHRWHRLGSRPGARPAAATRASLPMALLASALESRGAQVEDAPSRRVRASQARRAERYRRARAPLARWGRHSAQLYPIERRINLGGLSIGPAGEKGPTLQDRSAPHPEARGDFARSRRALRETDPGPQGAPSTSSSSRIVF